MLAPPADLDVGDRTYRIHRLDRLDGVDVARLPYTLRVLLEGVLRAGDEDGMRAVASWDASAESSHDPLAPLRQPSTVPPTEAGGGRHAAGTTRSSSISRSCFAWAALPGPRTVGAISADTNSVPC